MPKYKVEVTCWLGGMGILMAKSHKTHEFEARDDKAAEQYIRDLEGSSLNLFEHEVSVQKDTLSPVSKS